MGHRRTCSRALWPACGKRDYARTTARDIVAASGTNLGSIGYHYGSVEALLNAAVLAAIEEWGEQLTRAMMAGIDPDAPFPRRFERYWATVLDTFAEYRQVWAATFDLYSVAGHVPEVRAAIADGLQDGRMAWGAATARDRSGNRPRESAGRRITAPGPAVRHSRAVARRPGQRPVGRRSRQRAASDRRGHEPRLTGQKIAASLTRLLPLRVWWCQRAAALTTQPRPAASPAPTTSSAPGGQFSFRSAASLSLTVSAGWGEKAGCRAGCGARAWRPCAPQSACHRFDRWCCGRWLRRTAEAITEPAGPCSFPPSLP